MVTNTLFSILWMFAFTLSINGQGHLIDLNDDFCVDRAFQRWHTNMVSRFSKFAEFTSAMSQSRTLFQALFTQDFTTDGFKAYCSVHEESRKLYDKCQDSDARTLADLEFALADHICIKRVEIYSRNLPCLQTNNVNAFDQCRNRCREFEEGSRHYNAPSPAELSNSRMNWIPFMASDCQYLKCMTDCRKPIFQQKCNEIAAGLETDALKAAFAKKINYYDPPLMRNYLRDTFVASMIFPPECEVLADEISTPAP